MGLFSKLQNGDTVLKSLKFGNDRPGGGDSGQPYIQKPIPDALKDNNALDADFLLRGGINAPLDAFTDVKRLTKYMFNLKSPSGLLFTLKQNLLSRTAVKTEAAFGIGYAGGLLNEGIYTPLSTIAQAGVGFAGVHLNKQGIDPTGLIPFLSIRKYEDVVFKNSMDDFFTNSIDKKIEKVQKENEKNYQRSQNKINNTNNRLKTSDNIRGVSIGGRFFGLKRSTAGRTDRLKNKANDLTVDQINNTSTGDAKLEGLQKIRQSIIDGDNIKFNNRLLDLWSSHMVYVNDSPTILKYGGGPGSALGIGKTRINFATNSGGAPLRTGINNVTPLITYHDTSELFRIPTAASEVYNLSNPTYPYIPYDLIQGPNSYQENIINDVYKEGTLETQTLTTNIYNNYQTWTQENIAGTDRNLGENGSSGIRQDFRQKLNKSNSSFLSNSPDYTKYNTEDKFGMGSPGQKGDISSYTDGKKINGSPPQPLDKVNASYIYKSEGKDRVDAISVYDTDGNFRDIIPFYIAILNNDLQEKNSKNTYKKYMHFRAFIDGFSDSYDAEWKSIEYMGRGEKFYKYGGFDRKIDLSFTVVAQSRGEITAMYDKLNFLASSLAPEYLDALSSGYMAGNIAYITLGQYIEEQPGVITSLSFDIPEESPWEIGIDDNGERVGDADVRQVPHMIKVKLNFTPIHKFRPSKQRFGEDTPGTNSTRLLDTGGQRFIDQKRPKTTNYDKDVQVKLQERVDAEVARETADKEAIAKREADKDRIIQTVTPGADMVSVGGISSAGSMFL